MKTGAVFGQFPWPAKFRPNQKDWPMNRLCTLMVIASLVVVGAFPAQAVPTNSSRVTQPRTPDIEATEGKAFALPPPVLSYRAAQLGVPWFGADENAAPATQAEFVSFSVPMPTTLVLELLANRGLRPATEAELLRLEQVEAEAKAGSYIVALGSWTSDIRVLAASESSACVLTLVWDDGLGRYRRVAAPMYANVPWGAGVRFLVVPVDTSFQPAAPTTQTSTVPAP